MQNVLLSEHYLNYNEYLKYLAKKLIDKRGWTPDIIKKMTLEELLFYLM